MILSHFAHVALWKNLKLRMFAFVLTDMDADQLYQCLEAQNFPADVIESFSGNVGRYISISSIRRIYYLW